MESGYVSSENPDNKGNEYVEERKENGFFKYFLPILIIIILLIFGGVSFYLVRQTTFIFPRAAVTNLGSGVISLENSYVFASPVRAAIGGEEIRVTVFLLDEKGLGIPNRQVNLSGMGSLKIAKTQDQTDDTGRAFFDISASERGVYYLEAFSDTFVLPQKVRITFD